MEKTRHTTALMQTRWLMLAWIVGLFALNVSCSSVDCPVQTKVYTIYSVYGAEGADTLVDTLSVWTKRKDGTDTLVMNQGQGLTTFTLPISYNLPVDTFVFLVTDQNNYVTIDTVWIEKENYSHFESVDCAPSFFHEITAVRHTHRGIDSIIINHSSVDYDPSTEHFHIYFTER